MTVLDNFIAFAKALPSAQRGPVEEVLATIMATHSGDHDFSASELDELDRRMADKTVEYSSPKAITDLLGKPFSA